MVKAGELAPGIKIVSRVHGTIARVMKVYPDGSIDVEVTFAPRNSGFERGDEEHLAPGELAAWNHEEADEFEDWDRSPRYERYSESRLRRLVRNALRESEGEEDKPDTGTVIARDEEGELVLGGG